MKYKNSWHFFGAHIATRVTKWSKKTFRRWQQSKNKKRYISMAILFVVALVFIFSAVGLLAYRQPTNSKIVNGAIRIFPYPAAIVNGDMITLYDWQYEYFAWKKASELEGSQ